jgi:hypothetical protein
MQYSKAPQQSGHLMQEIQKWIHRKQVTAHQKQYLLRCYLIEYWFNLLLYHLIVSCPNTRPF